MNWNRYFLDLCYNISEKSKDPSTKVGCIITYPDNGICSTGFNGMPRGVNEDRYPDHLQTEDFNIKRRFEERPYKYMWFEHAERNAIYNAARHGHKTEGCTLYVPWLPCHDCARAIIQAGIKRIVLDGDYKIDPKLEERWKESHDATREMFEESGIECIFFKEGDLDEFC